MRSRGLVAVALLGAFILVASACSRGDSGDTTTTAPAIAITEAPGECPDPEPQTQLAEIANFVSTQLMAEYQIVRHDDGYLQANCWHDWSTDDCSVPIDIPVAEDFEHPCHRHDFGYRNYKRIERTIGIDVWTEAAKLVVDDQFLEDTREVCASRSFFLKQACLGWAQVFYWAVRGFGGFQDDLLD